MDVTPLVKQGAQIIQSYKNGEFKVSGTVHEGAVLVSPDETRAWDVGAFADLTVDSFDGVDAEVILLGTGAKMAFLPPDLRKVLKAEGFVIEVMDTPAACRTYNVLMAEGRRVIAALLPAGVF